MLKNLLVAVQATSILFCFQTIAQDARPDLIGRLVSYKHGGKEHYLGNFCLERAVSDASEKGECLRSQFKRGEDVVFNVDLMGNRPKLQGIWTPVGPQFDQKSAYSFYIRVMGGPLKKHFSRVWDAMWDMNEFNWSEISNPVPRKSVEAFLEMLQPNPPKQKHKKEKHSQLEERKRKLVGTWSLTPWVGKLIISPEKDNPNQLQFCLYFARHVTPMLGGWEIAGKRRLFEGRCFKESDSSLRDGVWHFSAQDKSHREVRFDFDNNGPHISMFVPRMTPRKENTCHCFTQFTRDWDDTFPISKR